MRAMIADRQSRSVRITRKRWPGAVVVAGTGITRLHDRVSRRTQPNRLDP